MLSFTSFFLYSDPDYICVVERFLCNIPHVQWIEHNYTT